MKNKIAMFFTLFLLLAWAFPVMAQIYGQDKTVHGYTRHDGTYVQPYHRTAPDHNQFNNYSTQGNINPYTGQMGTVNPYSQPTTPLQSNPYGHQQRRSWP
jgi:hypothetical protein